MVEATGFRSDEYAAELAAALTNTDVGTALLFENDRVRIWRIELAPGERAPFHLHRNTYFWVCTDGGRVAQRHPDGSMDAHDVAAGQVEFRDIPPNLIHDLENVGGTPVRYVTVELLGG
jgi:mannose-6-phosphate isomerase-like protein (cupin superfamily)